MLVLAGTTASLTDVSAGDDINVEAPGNIDAVNVSATGAGADTHILGLSSGSGSPSFTIGVGDGSGADIVIASANGAIDAAALSAGADILPDAAHVPHAAETDTRGNAAPTLSPGGGLVVNSAPDLAAGGVCALGNTVMTGTAGMALQE